MPRTRQYKKAEKKAVNSISQLFKRFFGAIGRCFSSFFRGGRRKLTVMIVPHSQKKVLNFQTSVFSLVFSCILLVGILGSFVWFVNRNSTSGNEITRLETENKESRASLDELRDESNNLLQSAKKFQTSLQNTLTLIGLNRTTDKTRSSVQNSDLSSLFDMQEISRGTLRETAEIRKLSSYLDGAIQPIEEIAKMLETQGTLFSDIPSIWPIKGGIGHISMPFGQGVHPITGQWYIHKGMDFSTWRAGDPIVSTANGQAVTVGFLPDLGKYVIVKHKHGFYTRYAHMNSTRVLKGEYVMQGDVIGTIGNTGVSTGPHLHYEVHIGANVVDPAKYINVTLKN